jgi:hypothetical protein
MSFRWEVGWHDASPISDDEAEPAIPSYIYVYDINFVPALKRVWMGSAR